MLQRVRARAALTGGGDPMGPAGPPGPGASRAPGGASGAPSGRSLVGVVGTGGHVPPLPIQVNALQALCRQLFGFRLAMTALAAPFALTSTETGLAAWLVGSAVLVTFMVSYVLMRDWERFGPVLLRHPSLLFADMLFGALLLFTATPNSPLGIVTICTPLLAGLVYGWRGAGVFAALQVLLLAAAYAVVGVHAESSALLLVGLCLLAGAVGGTLRGLLLRFGAASQALTETRARLAVSEAVEGERARLAREMHDSVAKTLHGLALAADGLASSADRMDPATVRQQAELVARSARRAASESRELLSDLRRASGVDAHVDLAAELAARAADFAGRSGLHAGFQPLPGAPLPALPPAVARHLLTIAGEAMENAHRHSAAGHVDVRAGIVGDQLVMSIQDDGRGLPPDTSLDRLRRAGHFGLVGMVERATGIGARIRIGKGQRSAGTEVRVDLPLAALVGAAPQGPAQAPLSTGPYSTPPSSVPPATTTPASAPRASVPPVSGAPGFGPPVSASSGGWTPAPSSSGGWTSDTSSSGGWTSSSGGWAPPPSSQPHLPSPGPLPLPAVPGFPRAEADRHTSQAPERAPGPAPDPSTVPLVLPPLHPGTGGPANVVPVDGARPGSPVPGGQGVPRELPALWQPPASQELPALQEPPTSGELPPLQEPPAAAPPHPSRRTPPHTP